MNKIWKVRTAALLLVVGFCTLSYAINQMLIIPNTGNVYTMGIEAYWDEAKTSRVTQIDWGTMLPGESKTNTIYLYNPGNTLIFISKTLSNWNPANLSLYITVTWNPDLSSLNPHVLQQTNITETISSTIASTMIEHYSYDIVITGHE